MASITVSEDVLALIRSFEQTKAESEDQILRRVLDGAVTDRKKRLKAYERADQDIQSTN